MREQAQVRADPVGGRAEGAQRGQDLVIDLPFNGTVAPDMQFGKDPVLAGQGAVPWNLISRNGQKIVSGIYIYSVDTDLGRQVGKFVVIR